MLSLEELKNYLRILDSEEDIYLQNLLDESDTYIKICVGDYTKITDKTLVTNLVKLVQKKICADLYENRSSYIEKNKVDRDITVSTVLQKLSTLTGR